MTTMMFYERLAPLNRDAHAGLRLCRDGFRFAARTNSAPLLAVEMLEAARSFPVVFVPVGQDQVFPVALLGLQTAENLFVDTDGGWEAGRYVPAFVRRYPFVLGEDMTVLIDEDASGLSRDEGDPLFDAEGQNTAVLENALAFLRGFQDEVARTQAFIQALTELDLFKRVSLTVETTGDQPFTLDGLMLVDGDKLAALPDEAVLRLFRSGELGWVQAHIQSLGGLEDLNRRRADARVRSAGHQGAASAGAIQEAAATGDSPPEPHSVADTASADTANDDASNDTVQDPR